MATQGRLHETVVDSIDGTIAAFLVLLLAPLTLINLSAARLDQLHPLDAWFPYLLVGGTLAAVVALGTVISDASRSRQDVYRALRIGCGLVICALGIGFLSGARYWGIDTNSELFSVIGLVTIAGGIGLIVSQVRVSRDSIPPLRWTVRRLGRIPLVAVIASALAVMFVVDGAPAHILAAFLITNPLVAIAGVLLIELRRALVDAWPKRLTHLIAAAGAVLAFYGLAGSPQICPSIWQPGPYTYTVSFEIQNSVGPVIAHGGCTSRLMLAPLIAGSVLLIAGPLLHRGIDRRAENA